MTGPTTSRLVLVMPCYNEAARFPEANVVAFIESEASVDFVFVDDGSDDGTAQVLQRVVAANPRRAELLRLERNGGKAEAVRAGLLRAIQNRVGQTARAEAPQPALVGFWDSDLATPLDAVPEFLEVLARNPNLDWVIGSRVKLLGRRIERRAARHYLGRVFATAASLILGVPVYDTQCGAKVFRVNAELESTLAMPFASRWFFDVELMGRYLDALRRRGVKVPEERIYEHPLWVWADVGASKVRLRDFIRAPFELLRIRAALQRPRR